MIEISKEIYYIREDDTLFDVIKAFEKASKSKRPTGIAVLVDEDLKVIGSFTDGDVRRALVAGQSLESKAALIANKSPISFLETKSYKEILDELPLELQKRGRKSKKFLSKIIIVNEENELVGILDYHQLWEQKVATHRHIVVLGLGYVGLTLAAVMAEVGYLISGVDTDANKIKTLKEGKSYIHEVGLEDLIKEHVGKNFQPVLEIPEEGDVYVISVGTPVKRVHADKNPEPIMDYIKSVSASIGKKLSRGNLVILRSTVPVGTTRKVVIPLLEKESGLICGQDFHVAFAPERTAEGKALKELRELPQIIGGFNSESTEATAAVFRELTSTIVRVSSLEAAEMVKLVNNTFRDLVFAYSNQVSQIATKFNIDVFEVVKAANQGYPRNPVPLPSPGVGGPCLTKDPYIFAKVAEEALDNQNTLFETGRLVNELMHSNIANRIKEQLQSLGKDPKKVSILVCGLAFKGNPETGDVRNSSAVEIYHLLKEDFDNVTGHDPVATIEDIKYEKVTPTAGSLDSAFENLDVVLFLNNHKSYENLNLFKHIRKMNDNPIVFDGWNLYREDDIMKVRPCVYMGLSHTKTSITK